jgi:hypothetical protein
MYNRFTKWIDAAPDLSSDESSLTQYNVDQYFLRSIPSHRGQESHLRKNVSSLQWYEKYREQVHLLPGEQLLVVCNDAVKMGLATQAIYMKTIV